MESRGRRVHSIEKAIRLLDCFWEADSPLSLHELEQRTGWAKSTIHGLLATMLDSAVVEQNPTDGKYRLGYHLFELGSAVRQGWSVPELCRPHLRAMAARLGESVHLARLSGDELILVACEAPQRGLHMTSETGTRRQLAGQGHSVRQAGLRGRGPAAQAAAAGLHAAHRDGPGAASGAAPRHSPRRLCRGARGIPAGPEIRGRAHLRG